MEPKGIFPINIYTAVFFLLKPFLATIMYADFAHEPYSHIHSLQQSPHTLQYTLATCEARPSRQLPMFSSTLISNVKDKQIYNKKC